MTRVIDAEDVRKAEQGLANAVESWQVSKAAKGLDRMADDYRFGGVMVTGEDTVDREMAIESLANYGSQSVSEYMYGD